MCMCIFLWNFDFINYCKFWFFLKWFFLVIKDKGIYVFICSNIYIYNRGVWYVFVKKMIKVLVIKYFVVLFGFVFRIFIVWLKYILC